MRWEIRRSGCNSRAFEANEILAIVHTDEKRQVIGNLLMSIQKSIACEQSLLVAILSRAQDGWSIKSIGSSLYFFTHAIIPLTDCWHLSRESAALEKTMVEACARHSLTRVWLRKSEPMIQSRSF